MAVVRSGSRELAALAARLKVAGDRGLRLELLRTLRAIPQPLISDVREAALQKLPQSGGLNERVANSPIKVQIRTSPGTAAVRIVASEHDARTTNFGGVRHPVYGNRNRWVDQDIPNAAGWFTDTIHRRTGRITGEMFAVMKRIGNAIQRGF